ncbi:valine--tRNA ligase [candidate division Kazan bacterium RIFCSPLOWO2_01_FULL_48_13]|uniref:Valine--tRNA ligase n=1 Tax=candidate division Kazan bacterium RIFCSPLOWO2_01_FULL_48_13 TaxID=1798539 RepID=A0A1F4PNG0_UNCK3|nr:MAG: valine--tRNA ligase [candidate division Kazan bacterium RIFCSPLOWO2_01_FULL_48_13]
MKQEIPKTFDPKAWETKLYNQWEDSGSFTPKIDPKQRPYTIIMPPPNANDQLHIGHALFVTLEDIMVRYHRMKGEPTLWLPGADHAGIASQVFFEKILKKEENKTRYDLGREKFVERLREFAVNKRVAMEGQLRRLGASCDWTRNKFTLDPDVSAAVYHTFKKMYDDGLIYRGERIINWCPRCATGLSDLEVEHQEVEGRLTYIKYPLSDGSGFIIVATTRPETMLGDTAVAVNPDDKRYKKLVGQRVKLPLTDREIPIVADKAVDKEFGTGAVKITPAHDPTDFEIGERHQLPVMVVIGQDYKMTDAAGDYAGLKINAARDKVLADLREQGLIEKQVEYRHSVGHCVRCKTMVEPLVSKQWFVKIAPLAAPAIAAVKTGQIKFIPDRFEKTYLNWMENIRDWNISRQLWWGHRIPVWFCKNQTGLISNIQSSMSSGERENFVVSQNRPAKCPFCKKCEMVQEEDTLDTWFSSGLWPFTTLGWPNNTPDFKYFYPTTVMETGWDIIFFWVARMIMLGIYCTGEVPFELVYMNGLVRDKEGNKISKSKGNVIDPIAMVDKYGADALRMGLVAGTAAGNDTTMSEDKVRAYRNFANKIWNAARFIQQRVSGLAGQPQRGPSGQASQKLTGMSLNDRDKIVLADFNKITQDIVRMMDKYQLGQAGELLYDYFWHTFCDKLIEEYKTQLTGERAEAATAVLGHILKNSLRLLHPFVPFVTEAVWQTLYEKEGLLLTQELPA